MSLQRFDYSCVLLDSKNDGVKKKILNEKNPLYMDLYGGLKASSTFLPFKSLPNVTRKGNVCIRLKGGVKD